MGGNSTKRFRQEGKEVSASMSVKYSVEFAVSSTLALRVTLVEQSKFAASERRNRL